MPPTQRRRDPSEAPRPSPRKRQGGSRQATYVPPLTTTHEELLSPDGDRDSDFRAVVYMMNTVLSRLQVCREAFGQSIALTATQFVVLLGVAHRQLDTGVSITALAAHLSIASTHVTTEVGRLVDMGLLRKTPHATDKRSVLISLTPPGMARVDEVSPLVQRVNDHLFRGMSAAEFKVLGEGLARIARNSEFAMAELRMQKMYAPAT